MDLNAAHPMFEDHNFTGGIITVFYERKFGLCPYYDNDSPDAPINGGLPQNVQLAEHLKRVEQQIQEQIPDASYEGLAVIDLEEKFLVETLITAKKLRPNALWGYFIYPFCNAKAGEEEDDYSCSAKAQKYNDELVCSETGRLIG
ncbi:unnamed protein product [Nippostrongylus brasiliensis]|uniref:Hyaluronidase n=1 Tax=Nippostrongylus brasiliensis TaxID=27835 RepID=A0A0N4YUK8_NIPBR|nr:unnamed protein product [Nippostrongylus brasiliensis]